MFPVHPQPVMEFSAQVNAMQHLKEQLEQRTRMIQANIQRQQEELRHIQEQLQRVQGQGIQVRRGVLHHGYKDFGMSCMHFHTADFESTSPVFVSLEERQLFCALLRLFLWSISDFEVCVSHVLFCSKPQLQYLNMLYPIKKMSCFQFFSSAPKMWAYTNKPDIECFHPGRCCYNSRVAQQMCSSHR